MHSDEGYIKYKLQWKQHHLPDDALLRSLITYRDALKEKNLIGIYPDGIGFGNISIRIPESTEFYISGTQTGNIEKTQVKHYARVTDYSFSDNALYCEGEVKASSEALTHGAFYMFGHRIHAVMHVHNSVLWNALKGLVPTTAHLVAYGTPEMAFEIQRQLIQGDLFEKQIIIMAGHQDGIFTFGANLEVAYKVLLDYYNIFH
ncbi:MAG: class II aldolase/adducin family protein [Chitinophagales bacterium]